MILLSIIRIIIIIIIIMIIIIIVTVLVIRDHFVVKQTFENGAKITIILLLI